MDCNATPVRKVSPPTRFAREFAGVLFSVFRGLSRDFVGGRLFGEGRRHGRCGVHRCVEITYG